MQWFINVIVAICKAYTDQEILDLKAYTDAAILNGKNMPSGSIVLWHDRFINIPDGWFFCNGENGTPDLRDRFVLSVGLVANWKDIGGSNNHTHGAGAGSQAGKDKSATAPNIPPYFALFFIMKS